MMNANVKIKEKVAMQCTYRVIIFDGDTGEHLRTNEFTNKIPNVGLQAVGRQVFGLNTQELGANSYVALGTSATAPSSSDTTLGTEVQRKVLGAVAEVSASVFSGEVYFAKGEATGTWQEIGLFLTGSSSVASATVNTGVLFSHALFPVSVSATEGFIVEVELTLSSAT